MSDIPDNPAFPDGRPEEEQPKWRRDFPIDWPRDDYVSRRDFTKFLGVTSFAFVVGQGWIAFRSLATTSSMPRRKIGSAESIPVGGTVLFCYPGDHDDCILIRTDMDRFVAYSQKCTHLSCPVQAVPDRGELYCPCHHGVFELATGRPLAGPPRRPLPIVQLEISDGIIWATGLQERTA